MVLTVYRIMPKRPCAIVITSDDSNILCADKFGDVYSLPLMGQASRPGASKIDKDLPIEEAQASFSLSATSLTVHTKRNRDALRQQQQQHRKKNKSHKPEKLSLCFDHQLLLGHVSLLTDMAFANIESAHSAQHYILTSDRDEHIRVSRASPQAHIIEGFCLGHTEFVSKLCVMPTYPHLLVSGGGDDYLLMWDWKYGVIRQTIDLKNHVKLFRDKDRRQISDKVHNTEFKIAVTNIVSVKAKTQVCIVVTCEA